MKKLLKGNEAAVVAALVADCDAFFGYPITPASEIAHTAALLFPRLGRVFLQAESELGAINMVFGAAAAGRRAMTASSSPGISLKMEGISYLACAEMPCVIVDVMRAGPGLGNIGPEQSDYFQIVKGGGHGDYRVIVLAPGSVREMYQFTLEAFDLADKYRTPVVVLTDATTGQMMAPVEIGEFEPARVEKPWQLDATAATNDNVITSIYLDFDEMEAHVGHLDAKYAEISRQEARAELYLTEDAEILVTGYGIVGRLLHSLADDCRARGLRVGLIRPQTLWPFPAEFYRRAARPGVPVLTVELSKGQLVEDVRLTLPGSPVHFYGRSGGNLPTREELVRRVEQVLRRPDS